MADGKLTPPRRLIVPLGRDFTRLKQLVIQRTGHHYYHDKDEALWDRVSRRMHSRGTRSLPDYVAVLEDADAYEWSALEAEITIGETYFFRYAEQFTALADTILPSLIEKNRAEKRLRIWSAGCATGAEPYSVAVLLWRLLGESLHDWRITILGTDINEKFLAAARKGQFGRWALRTLTNDERDQFFTQIAPQSWELKRAFKAMVQFERQNLMDLVEGVTPLQFTEFDLILCRNVLIYFDPATIPQLITAFRDRMKEGGWMLLGHAEPNPQFSSIMRAEALPGTAAYRNLPPHIAHQPLSIKFTPLKSPPPAVKAAPPKPAARPRPQPTSPPRAPVPAPITATEFEAVEHVRTLSNSGNLMEALQACNDALGKHDTEPRLYFYQGLLKRGLGEGQSAEESLKRALFLNRTYVMAHYHLGLIQFHRGNRVSGRRHLANAARLSLALPQETALLDGDGLQPDTLIDLVRFHLDHDLQLKP